MSDNSTFADLPDALVRQLLESAQRVGERVHKKISGLTLQTETLRQRAREAKLILARADLDVVREPSVCGIDGSYQVHRLTALDLCAAAAVAVEGTAKEDRRHWEKPHHRMWVDAVEHADPTVNALRGVTVSMELELARMAPHDVVLLDGAFSPLVIWLNQAHGALVDKDTPEVLRDELRDRLPVAVESLFWALEGARAVAVPKYASRNELAALLGIAEHEIDGKTLATVVLEAGEYTRPLPVYEADAAYHLTVLGKEKDKEKGDRLARLMKEVRVIYYRPYGWLPAIRIEVTTAQVNDLNRRALVLEAITRQLFSPATFEPYPLLLADRMVKSLGAGVNAVETAVGQYVIDQAENVEDSLQFLRQHRTEGGRTY